MFVSVGAWRPCSMRLMRVKCCPVAAARACPVSPAVRRSWRRRAPSSLRAWVTELLGAVVIAHEIRVRLGGISRQRVYQLTSRRDFPTPIAELGQGKIWLSDDIEAWITQHRSGTAEDGTQPGELG